MASPSLRELQQWMRSRIRPGAARAPSGGLLNPQRGVPGEERLAVYAEGYAARMREALTEVYEAVHHVLGERAFTELAEAYARRFPSQDYNLSFAGRSLPEFLTDYPLTRSLPFLPDLASLEWLICRAFHAFDQPPLAVSPLASMSPERWEQVTLRFQPSVGAAASAWPIRDLWAARAIPRAEMDLQVAGRPQHVLVCRRGEQVACELLDPREYRLLDGLLRGGTLGAVCGELAASDERDAPVGEWFARWASTGLIARFELAAAPGMS